MVSLTLQLELLLRTFSAIDGLDSRPAAMDASDSLRKEDSISKQFTPLMLFNREKADR
jgi:hypothetical protein